MRRGRAFLGLATLVLTSSPALAVTVSASEDFSSGWFATPDTAGAVFSIEGVTGAAGAGTLDTGVEFAPVDARLLASNGSESGGFYYENGVSGNGSQWNAGDNQMVYMDYTLPVPNGTYTFNVSIDAQIYWTDQDQPWGRGYEFYFGDAADLAYGTQAPHNAPTGPWQGQNWNGGANTMDTELIPGTNVFYNGADENDNQDPNLSGQWRSWNFTSNTAGSTLNVTSNEVIFRVALRLKNANQASPEFSSWAFDNLNITLTPEPGTAGLLAFGLIALLNRRRRRA